MILGLSYNEFVQMSLAAGMKPVSKQVFEGVKEYLLYCDTLTEEVIEGLKEHVLYCKTREAQGLN